MKGCWRITRFPEAVMKGCWRRLPLCGAVMKGCWRLEIERDGSYEGLLEAPHVAYGQL